MTDPCLLFSSLFNSDPYSDPSSWFLKEKQIYCSDSAHNNWTTNPSATVKPEAPKAEYSYPHSTSYRPKLTPKSGAQLYSQRLSALKAGRLYTKLPENSFYESWSKARQQPSHQEWQKLVALEAGAVAKGQGQNRLNVLLGDSLCLWFPAQMLPEGKLWLNQGISGERTEHILQRLSAFTQTRPDTIYVMAGINDLRYGASDATILHNTRLILRKLKQNHPHSKVIIQSILPTRWASLPRDRISRLNQQIYTIAQQEGAIYLDIFSFFLDEQGMMRKELTTDGLHLSEEGYRVWQSVLQQAETWLASGYSSQR